MDSVPLAPPLNQQSSDEVASHNEEELARLVRMLDFAEELTIFFARVNTPVLRRQLIDEAKRRLAAQKIRVVEIEFEGEIIQLRKRLREKLREVGADPSPALPLGGREPLVESAKDSSTDSATNAANGPPPPAAGGGTGRGVKLVLFILGLEYSIPYNEPAVRMLAELNLGREFFQRDAPHPLVFWLPNYAVTAVACHAPDFWAWRSGVFEFEVEESQRVVTFEQHVQRDSDWLSVRNLSVRQKQQRLRILESILDDYERLPANRGRRDELADIFFELAKINQALDTLPAAIDYYERYLTIRRDQGNRGGEGAALGNLGNAYRDLGQLERAVDYYEQAVVISREIGDRRGEGNHLGNLGLAYADLGQVERAIDYYEQALVISREIGDRRGEGNHLGNLGLAYADLGQVERAIDYYEQALVISREIGDRRGEGNRLGNLGNAYGDLGQVERAIDYHEQALVISREIGDRRGEGNDLGNLGNAYYSLGQVKRAVDSYEQAVVISREIGDRRGEGAALGNLGNAYGDLGQVERAIGQYEQRLEIARKIGDRRGEALGSWNLGLHYEAQGRYAEAAALMQPLVDYERELGHPAAEGHAAELAEVRRKAEAAAEADSPNAE